VGETLSGTLMSSDFSPTSPLPTALSRRALLALVDASQAINQDLGAPAVFKCIAQHAANVLHAQGASVLLLDSTRQELVFATVTGPASEQVRGERMSADLGIAGQAVRTRRAVRVDDVGSNRHFFAGIDAKTNLQTQSIMAAPLLHRHQVLGVVEVINPVDRPRFDDSDLELLKVFANLAAAAMRNAQHFSRIMRENEGLRRVQPKGRMIGESAALQRVMALCRKVAAAPTTVLITGETGTGKEMAARTVHQLSPRCDQPFIAVNCAALTETLLESELFGHEKGAFTGAAAQKLGRFELADGGTLFLDEVGEISPSSQTKLLRVLQEREFNRVGGVETITCDVRIIAATNRNLKAEVEAGRFREDLFYRLNIFPVEMPPLRQRHGDVEPLARYFIEQVAAELKLQAPRISDEAMAALQRYLWPGNIRELRNVIERCTLLADQVIHLDDLPPEIASADGSLAADVTGDDGEPSMISQLEQQERATVLAALQQTGWNQSAAARKLGLSRDHLRYRVKKYGLKRDGKKESAS